DRPEGQRRRDDGVAAPPEAVVPGSLEGQRRRDDGVAAPPEAAVPGSLEGKLRPIPGRAPCAYFWMRPLVAAQRPMSLSGCGACSGAGCSRTRWALVPLMPKEE